MPRRSTRTRRRTSRSSTPRRSTSVALLELDHVTQRFGGLVAVNDLSFSVEAGSIVAMIGPNGAGKSTAFNLVTGIYKPSSGRIIFDGRDAIALVAIPVTSRPSKMM